MNQHDREINDLVAEFWREKEGASSAASQIRSRVLATPPGSAIVAGRALSVIKSLNQSPAWAARVEDFAVTTARLIERCHQIDKLGDPDTDPAAVFEVLGEDTADLGIESFDSDALRQARVDRRRPDAARAFLHVLGTGALPPAASAELERAVSELEHRSKRYQSHALFAAGGYGVALGVRVHEGDQGQVDGFNQADAEMRQQAEVVLRHYFSKGAQWDVEWELPYGGSSIGLALAIAALVSSGKAQADPLLAATGRIGVSYEVDSVGSVPEKVQGAVSAGFRRVLVPVANEKEALEAVAGVEGIMIIPIERLDQLEAKLSGLSGAVPIGSDGAIRFIRKLAPRYGLDVVGEDPLANCFRLTVADAATEAFIDVYRGAHGTVTVGGKGSAKDAAEQLIAKNLPKSVNEPRGVFSVLVASAPRRDQLQTRLVDRGAEALPTGPYEAWRYQVVDGPSKAVVIMYTSGKCVIPAGRAPAHDEARKLVESVLAGLGGIPQAPAVVREEPPVEARSEATVPHIGTDEAGKGDYFGPLVCAACYVDAETAEKLRALGVRDSKTLSDKVIHRLAEEIRSLGRVWAVTTIQPSRYNTLYAQMRGEGKNLNTLVAWGHARSIEDLLGRGIEVEYAVIDKFADERYLREKVLAGARRSGMRFDHRVRGESDIAVAAASILARDTFVTWLAERSRRIGFTLPKGASPEVIRVARNIVATGGEQALAELAKLSFKTTQTVVGTADV